MSRPEGLSPAGGMPKRRPLKLLKVTMGVDPQEGGPTEVVLTTTAGETAAGMLVTVAIPSTGSDGERANVEFLRSTGADVVRFPLGKSQLARRWAISPALLIWMAKFLRRFDAIHIHGAWGLVPVVALGLVRVARKPCVLTVHEALTNYDLRQTRHRYLICAKRVGRRVILALAGDIVVSSDLERRDSAPSRDRIHVIPHPVADRAAVRPVDAENAQRHAAVGFIGRFHEKKNLPLLLEALTRLPDHELVVAGHGTEQVATELRKLAEELGVSRRVTWLGWIGPDERAAFYRRIGVLAMPSVYECYGMAAAEAMMSGTPVVVSGTTGAADLVRESGGGLVAPRDARRLADTLASLLSDEGARLAAGERAAQFAADRLTPLRYGETILRLYRG